MGPRFVLLLTVLYCASNVKITAAEANHDWWKNSVIYQIYPQSFKDSNNDGKGDIQGIISKLQHLKELGVTAAWLSPIYKSPKADMGYDISDFYDIDPDYGTMADFDDLVKLAHGMGIKIIMDFVPNHSSIEHDWFVQSENRNPAYEDFYIWRDGNSTHPPNNWVSHFKGSAWSYSDIRKQCYLHQFFPEQPDLNYRNPAVKTEMEKILKFWLDKGVDGFRMDAVSYLVEDELFEDEPASGDPNAQPGDYESLNHIYTSDHPDTYNMIYAWRSVIDKYNKAKPDEDPRIIMTESYTTLENTMKYYQGTLRKGAHFPFNFFLITDLDARSKAQDIVATIDKWMTNMPKGAVANWVLGNHDRHRVATRHWPGRIDGMNMLTAFLPGVMVTYNGEEIGQENGDVPLDKCNDPRDCNSLTEEEYRARSRDFERTPFHWDNSTNAGFNEGADPWLPVSAKYIENNLAAQKVDGINSHYHIYRELLKFRQIPGFSESALSYTALSDNVLAVTRSIPEGSTYVLVINTWFQEEVVNLSSLEGLREQLSVRLMSETSDKKKGWLVDITKVVLRPYESFIGVAMGDSDWWKHAVIYQIYPLSFKDTDNTGEGDLRGVINKLEHLKDAGVTAAWLSPIYASPNVDQGYDISDFRAIDPKFGTFDDFKDLVKKAHDMGLKIVMDFVPNHSSDQHEWFVKSKDKDPAYRDYYTWVAGSKAPNNWKSLFGGNAWTCVGPLIGQKYCYLHQFAKEQPDLNYRNPKVVEEMKDVLRFWLDHGVDAFRMDAVPYLFEDPDLKDEDLLSPELPPDEHDSYHHIYTSDLDETFDMIYQWRELVDEYTLEHGGDARVLMTEAYTDIDNTMRYYGTKERDGAHFTFNFQLITKISEALTATEINTAIQEWLVKMPPEYVANWVIGNHDNHRVATRFGKENADGFNMLIGILPGVMVTYNGEEIGQENGDVPFSKCKDPRACKNEETFIKRSRDFERTPFHWDNTVNAGFNDGTDKEPWLPVSKKYPINNLKEQSNPGRQSHYQVYKKLLKIRQAPTLVNGTTTVTDLTANVLGCTRILEGSDTYLYVFNVANTWDSIDLKNLLPAVTPYVEILLVDSRSLFVERQLIESSSVVLAPHECIIARTTNEVP